MAKTGGAFELVLAPRTGATPLHRWLRDELRRAILEGRLRAGGRLPSSRSLAKQYRVARGTVVSIYEQLTAEGYLESHRGSGSYVRQVLPDRFFEVQSAQRRTGPEQARVTLSRRGNSLAHSPFPLGLSAQKTAAFRTDHPDVDVFPTELWSRIAARRLRRLKRSELISGAASGFDALRQAIAAQVGSTRGITCTADQVMVTSGTQQSLDLVARLLLDPGDGVLMEDPGYPGARALFEGNGASICPVHVDDEGFNCAEARRKFPQGRLAYVTPAHQYPLGVVLSAGRRMELLRWAQENDGWIFEDDYDGEFRFSGRPLAALKSLDSSGHVIYAASFSKVLFPTLRLGYMILPKRLVDRVAAARSLVDRYPAVLEQAILCDFIAEGHFGRHIRRMREVYSERCDVLRRSVEERLGEWLELANTQAGLQTVGWLKGDFDDRVVERNAEQHGIVASALSRYAIARRLRPGLLMGFATTDTRMLNHGIEELAHVLRRTSSERQKEE